MEITKWQIISSVVGLLLSTFFSTFLKRMWELYIPDKNAMSSYIKNLIYYSLRYVYPISVIIWTLIFESLDKYFVLIISFFVSTLFCNLALDLVAIVIKKQNTIIDRVLTLVEHVTIESSKRKTLNELESTIKLIKKNIDIVKPKKDLKK